ncbi:MAG: glutamate-cysteine ligase family protein [Gudongella sp.]|jgi:glutamate--cysteine ligase|nr:glutamate-cysteine ligase family protein [Gudongella sp.]
MDKKKQIELITEHIRRGEKPRELFKLGVEIEHFVLWEDSLKTVSYYGADGVETTLREISKNGWEPSFEGDYMLALKKGDLTITLEPGSQLEVSIEAKKEISEIEESYMRFLDELLPVLESKGQVLAALGYHPVTRIEEITLLPKKRYDIMFDYFKNKGSHAHNMMKGTGAFQVSIDYSDENDYRRKFRVVNALAPVFYGLFENALFFEGEPCITHNLRAYVWMNCDNDRAGTVEAALKDDYSYEDYAKYLLEKPPIFTIRDNEIVQTHDKKIFEIMDVDDISEKEVEHLMTMFFPDARTKDYIEIRMMDSVPYPLNMAAVALIKGTLYDEDNLKKLYEFAKPVTAKDILASKIELLDKGMDAKVNGKSVLEIGKWMLEMARSSLGDESKYLEPLEELLMQGKNPYVFTKENFHREDRREAVQWAILRR